MTLEKFLRLLEKKDTNDGFRIECHVVGDKIKLYTRNFEEVTKQFPDVVEAVRKYVKCENCIFDSEVVGFNPKTTQYVAFQQISQRIRRKYDIEEAVKKLPVEINVFDVLYYNGKSTIDKPFHERRAILNKIVHPKDRVIDGRVCQSCFFHCNKE